MYATCRKNTKRVQRAAWWLGGPGEAVELPDKHHVDLALASELHQQLRGAGIDTVIITGGETDVCVMATVLGAIDWGFRVILVTDALCSSADETHDAMMNVYLNRVGEQVETVTTATLLQSWQGTSRRKAS